VRIDDVTETGERPELTDDMSEEDRDAKIGESSPAKLKEAAARRMASAPNSR
jgi:hypothetical protein